MSTSLRTDGGTDTGYGSRPVAVDLVRGHRLTQTTPIAPTVRLVRPPEQPSDHLHIDDQLALAHWPAEHRIVVSSVAGGTGRTTLAGLIARTLADLPYASVHRPVAIAELEPAPLSQTRNRWGVPDGSDQIQVPRTGGLIRVRTDAGATDGSRPVVIDSLAGLDTTVRMATADPTSSVVLLTRPDGASLADLADALIWLHDSQRIHRDRITVVINHGVGQADRGSRPAATALWIRCSSVHRLPAHPTLGPGRSLPFGRNTPRSVRRSVVGLSVAIHNSVDPGRTASPEEEADAQDHDLGRDRSRGHRHHRRARRPRRSG